MPEAQEDAAIPEPTSFSAFREVVGSAFTLRRRGQTAEALRAVDLAQASLKTVEVPRTREGAETLNHLGMTLFEAGYHRAARGLYDRSLTIAESLGDADAEMVESVLNNLGQVHDRLGNANRARSYLERAVEMRERRAPDTAAHALVLDNLGGVYARAGELALAEAHHARALAILQRERGPFDPDVATALGNLGGVYSVRRDLDRAEAFRLRAFDTHARAHGLESPEALTELSGLVSIYLEKGDQERADALVNHALTIGGGSPRPEHRFLAEILRSLAHVAFGEFRLDLAERLIARCVELLEVLEGPAAPETLAALHILANVQRATHDLDHAERNYRRAVQGLEAAGDSDAAVAASIDLAKVYRERGAYQLGAMALSTAATSIRQSATPNVSLLASALGNLAELYYEWGRHEQADATYGEALDALRDSTVDVERPWLFHGRAILNYHRGRYSMARDLYQEARRIWIETKGEDHPFVATTTANLALAHWAVGDIDPALEAFQEAAARRDKDMRRILAVGSERKRLLFARGSLDDLQKVLSFLLAVAPFRQDVTRFAAQLTLQRKGLVLDALAHTFAQLRRALSTEDRALIDRLQILRTEIAGVLTPSPLAPRAAVDRARLERLRDEEEKIEAALSYRGALHDPDLAPVTIEAVQRATPADAALVELIQFRRFNPMRSGENDVWAEERCGAFIVHHTGEPRWVDLGPSAPIDVAGDQLRRALRSRSTPVGDLERASAELYAMLMAPLADAIGDARHLIISPDGKLTMVPLGMLRDSAGRMVSDRCTVSYVAAAREVHSASAVGAARASGVVVIAAPDYDAGAAPIAALGAVDRFADRGTFAPLGGVKAEADEIGALLAHVTVIEGASATVEAVERLRAPAVLHIATHGFFSPVDEPEPQRRLELLPIAGGVLVEQVSQTPPANPMFFSGLALAGANRRAAGTSTGILTAQQIAALDLRGTQLVVLSACETGLGTVGKGSEFTGMRRALSIAGAATQITSLWRVGDEATRVLMRHFYRLLLRGAGRAEALARAQQEVASDAEHPEWTHPFYWAAFVLSGAWSPMGDALAARPAPPNG